ncbi:MAG: hypothetical protein RIT81_36455 [Deltaproteobacteria bacterium]
MEYLDEQGELGERIKEGAEKNQLRYELGRTLLLNRATANPRRFKRILIRFTRVVDALELTVDTVCPDDSRGDNPPLHEWGRILAAATMLVVIREVWPTLFEQLFNHPRLARRTIAALRPEDSAQEPEIQERLRSLHAYTDQRLTAVIKAFNRAQAGGSDEKAWDYAWHLAVQA